MTDSEKLDQLTDAVRTLHAMQVATSTVVAMIVEQSANTELLRAQAPRLIDQIDASGLYSDKTDEHLEKIKTLIGELLGHFPGR